MGIVIGFVIALIFLSKGGLSALTGTGNFGTLSGSFAPEATPAAPVPASTGAPLTPAQTTFAVSTATAQGANDLKLVSTGTQIATTEVNAAVQAGDIASSFATVVPVVGAVVSAVAQVLLAQHTARLKGAIAENQLVPQTVQAFDADIAELVTAYNAGQIAVSKNGQSKIAATAIQQMDTSLYTVMKSNATGPGRAWTDVQGFATNPIGTNNVPACNKACTAECCIFWNDMNNIMAEINRYLTGQPTQTILSVKVAGGMNFTVPEVVQPPVQYGTFSRAKYTINLVIPSNAT